MQTFDVTQVSIKVVPNQSKTALLYIDQEPLAMKWLSNTKCKERLNAIVLYVLLFLENVNIWTVGISFPAKTGIPQKNAAHITVCNGIISQSYYLFCPKCLEHSKTFSEVQINVVWFLYNAAIASFCFTFWAHNLPPGRFSVKQNIGDRSRLLYPYPLVMISCIFVSCLFGKVFALLLRGQVKHVKLKIMHGTTES